MIRIALPLAAAALLAAVETPDPSRFVVPAGRPAVLPLTLARGSTCAWTMSDAVGRAEQAGTLAADAAGSATIAVTPAAGWHELAFADGSRLGLIAQDPVLAEAAPDPFFAVDAAMAWLVKDDARRAALARMARALGLGLARERLSWNAIQPEPGRFDGAVHHRNDALRGQWGAAGMPLLECFHDAPAWMGRATGKYPLELAAAAEAWTALGARWPTTAAVEVWNEPDLTGFSGGGMPDHLVALHHAVRWGLARGAPQVLVGGGVLTGGESRAFRARLWDNGLHAASDFISFHDYREPVALEPYVERLRVELAAAGDAAVPLWITESGKPWPVGTPRPELGADTVSAATILVRTAEARALGIARHCAFVLPFYPENRKNFGLTGRDGTPLLCLSAYGHIARRLAGLAYLGDLAVPGAVRARLFGAAGRAVAVVWLGGVEPGRRWTAGFPLRSAHGMDGRPLAPAADGSLPVPEGVALCEVDPAAMAGLLRRDTPAMRLTAVAKAVRAPSPPRPVVLQTVAAAGSCEPLLNGWRLAGSATGTVLAVRAWNLGGEDRSVRLRLSPPDDGRITDGEERRLALAAGCSATAQWLVVASGPGVWRVAGAGADAVAVAPLAIAGSDEPDGGALLARLPTDRRIAVPDAAVLAVDGNIAAGASCSAAPLAEGGVRLAMRFPAGTDNWAYPRIPAPAGLAACDAVLVRLRCARPAAVRLFVFEGGSGWYTQETLVPADGRWHWALVRLADLDHCAATPPDDDGRLDLGAVRYLSIGFNSDAADNALDIDRWHLLRLNGGAP